MDANGNGISDEQEGLLTYKDGTVCDDYFSSSSADAVCREMGYYGALSWRNGHVYGSQQSNRPIRLDDVRCSSNVWSSCTSITSHNCGHHEDVLISCELGKALLL